jgi:hypothetical protein
MTLELNAEFTSRLYALPESVTLPDLAIDLSELVPAEELGNARKEVVDLLRCYVVAEEILPDLLQREELWRGTHFPDRERHVVQVVLPQCYIRLHWVYPNQPLGFHPHGSTDIYGIKARGYEMDMGFGDPKEEAPARSIINQSIPVGSIYPMFKGAWHEIRHSGDQPSVSLNIKKRKDPTRPPRASKRPAMAESVLRQKLQEFARFYS